MSSHCPRSDWQSSAGGRSTLGGGKGTSGNGRRVTTAGGTGGRGIGEGTTVDPGGGRSPTVTGERGRREKGDIGVGRMTIVNGAKRRCHPHHHYGERAR
jgi:hypothetical protein